MVRAALLAISISILLAGCGGDPATKPSQSRYLLTQDTGPSSAIDLSHVKNAIPRHEPKSRYGNPTSYVVRGKRYYVKDSHIGYKETGIASWYGKKFHGHRTSSGEPYDMYKMTAAHKTLPLPSYVTVRSLKNGRSVIVKVNDRGPFHANRIIDLSYAAAHKLGYTGQGTAMVEISAIDTRPQAIASRKLPLSHKIYLQAGAFSNRDNALKYRQKLIQMQTHDVALVAVTNSDNSTLYRVQIGPMENQDQADEVLQKLHENGIKGLTLKLR